MSKQLYASDFSSRILPLYALKKAIKGQIYPINDSLSVANTMVKISAQYVNPFVSYNHFSKRMQFIFPIFAVQINFSVVATL